MSALLKLSPQPVITWSWIPGVSGIVIESKQNTWPELLDVIRDAGPYPNKSNCPLLKLAVFGPRRSNRRNLRTNDNLVKITGLEGDYDGEKISMEEAISTLEKHGIKAAIYPSSSYTPDAPRWRVICPLFKPCLPQDRARMMARLNGALGGVLASESFVMSQSYYFGRINSYYQVLATYNDPDDGSYIDQLDELDQIAIGKTPPAKKDDTAQHQDGPVEMDIFRDAVARHGRKLKTGDGRRELLKTYIASRSARGIGEADLWAIVKGIEADYFDPDDPIDDSNIRAMVREYVSKDYLPPVDISGLMNQASPTPGKIEVKRLGDLALNPQTEWIVGEWVPADIVGELVGQTGCGKTFFWMDIAAHVALGIEWQGRYVKQGAVIFLVGEGEKGLGKRRQAWELRHPGHSLTNAPFYFIDAVPNLMNVQELKDVIEAIESIHKVEPVRLVLVDTKSQHTAGEDEDNSAVTSKFIRHLIELRKATGAAVIYNHHTGHNNPDRGRGSSAGPANVDLSILMKPTAAGATIQMTKAKDWATPSPLTANITQVSLGYLNEQTLDDETSAVIEYVDLEPMLKKSKMQKLLDEAIEKAGTDNRDEVRAAFYELHPGNTDAKRKAFARAWQEHQDGHGT